MQIYETFSSLGSTVNFDKALAVAVLNDIFSSTNKQQSQNRIIPFSLLDLLQ